MGKGRAIATHRDAGVNKKLRQIASGRLDTTLRFRHFLPQAPNYSTRDMRTAGTAVRLPSGKPAR